MIRILFICHGNICRSPMAEFLFNDLIKRLNIEEQIHSDSAATSTEEIGNPIYPPAKRELYRHGIRCSDKYARQIEIKDYNKYNLLIAMEEKNIKNMENFWSKDPENKIYLLMDYTDTPKNVADPWYTGNFVQTWDDILNGCVGIIRKLETENKLHIDKDLLNKDWREYYE